MKINSQELHIITGWDIKYCRSIFKDNYLPSRTTFKIIAEYTDHTEGQLNNLYELFKKHWYGYVDNKAYILNDPFKDDGFKIGKKVKFIMEHLNERHKADIQLKWSIKKKQLENQMTIE